MNRPRQGKRWWELRLRPDPGSFERAAGTLLDVAPSGLVEEGGELIAYLPDAASAYRAGLEVSPDGGVRIRPVQEADWSRWRQHFAPVQVGETLRVVPVPEGPDDTGTTEEAPAPTEVHIEPGAAFGTGEHPTTAACLRYLERLVRPGVRVLDVGTGSGVLAIAAALLGAGHVLAVDSDSVACRAVAHNLTLNPAAGRSVEVLEVDALDLLRPEGATSVRGTFDIITANLSSALLRLLAGGIAMALCPAGRLVASGLSWENRLEVEHALGAAGLCVYGRTVEAGWVTILAHARGGQ